MRTHIDYGYYSIFHYGEEVCGDRVVFKPEKKRFMGVLADGMGSGVKANILSTMGSTILSTMLTGGEPLESAVDMVVRSLPVCSERGLNYCTFSVVSIDDMGYARLAEFDNPQAWIIRNGQILQPDRALRTIEGKNVYESELQLVEDDMIVVTSDGAVNCGVDNNFSFSWTWDSVADWLCRRGPALTSARRVARELIEAVNNLYGGRPTDDCTAMVIRITKEENVSLMYGPPEYPEDDEFMVKEFMENGGTRIICGGTTAGIVARVLDYPVETLAETAADGVPPISFMPDIDLVTEGLLTMTRAADIMERYFASEEAGYSELDAENGAAILARQLIERCTSLQVYIGRAQNEGYAGKDVPLDLNMKMKAIDRICELLDKRGVPVTKYYY